MIRQTFTKCIIVVSMMWVAFVALQGQENNAPKVEKINEDLVRVTVSGKGMSEDDALRDAKRKAVEYGAGAFISSVSRVKDFQLTYDTIISRSTGFVQDTEVVEKAKMAEDGIWSIRIKAGVSIKSVQDRWAVVQNFLKDKGRPKIMLLIDETVDGKPVEDSTVRTKLEGLLLKSGFLLVDAKQLAEIKKIDVAAAMAENKPDKLLAIAKKFDAQLVIAGTVESRFASVDKPYQVDIFRYGAKGNIRCLRTDDAQLLASQNDQSESADRIRSNAADKALSALSDNVGPKVQDDILRVWLDEETMGGSVKLEIEGVTLKQATALAEQFKKIKEVKDVGDPEIHNQIAEFNLQATTTAKTLAKALLAIKGLDVTDISQNVIKASYKP